MPEKKASGSFLKTVKNIISRDGAAAPADFLSAFEKAFSVLNQPYLIFTQDYTVVYINPAFTKFTGSKKMPDNIASLLGMEDFEAFKKQGDKIFSPKGGAVIELEIASYKKVWGYASYLGAAAGVKYVSLCLQEMPAPKPAEEKNTEILKTNAFLRGLFSTLPMGFYLRGKGGNVTMYNTYALKFLGDAVKKGAEEKVDKKSIKDDLANDEKVFKSGRNLNVPEFRFKDTAGAEHIFHVMKAPVKDEAGKINTVLTLFEDVTEKIREEEEILKTKNLFQSILDYAPMAIYTRNAKGGLSFWNKKTVEIYEDTPQEVAKAGAHKNQTKEEAANYISRESEIIKNGKAVVYPQETYTTKKGNKLMLHLVKVPIPAIGSNPATVLTIVQDITEQHRQGQENQRTQNILQTVFDNAPVAIFARDAKGALIFANNKTKDFNNLISAPKNKEDKERDEFYRRRELSILKSGKLMDIPVEEYTDNEGKPRTMHAIKVPVYDNAGNPLMVITIGEDVTGTREKEAEVLRSKNFLQEIIDNLPLALFAKKYTGEYIMWNKKSEEVFGKTAAEVLGKTHYNDDITPEQEEFIRTQDQRVFESAKELDIPQELISTQKEGIKIMHTVKTPLFYEDGTANCLLGVSEDITSKTKMERTVYESRTKYSLLVENSREGILIIEQGKISFVNKTLLTALGYEEEDLNGKDFYDLIAKENLDIARDFYEKVTSGTAARDYAVIKMHNKTEDEVIEFEASAAVSKYLGKKILIMFLRNITKERRMEKTVKNKDDKFLQVFETAKTPFVVLQNNGYVFDMNASARDIFGFTKEDKALYSSIYIKPALPLKARKAMADIDPSMFDAKVDFDKLKATLPDIMKTGALDLNVIMTPINERTTPTGKVLSDFLLELSLKADGAAAASAGTALTSDDILSYQDAVIIASKEGHILKCNNAAQQLLGFSLAKIQGKALKAFFSKEDDESLTSDIKELYSQGSIKSRNYNLKHGNSFIPVEATAVLAKENNFMISLRNITARKQLGDLLRERSEHLEALAKVVDGALLECDIDNNVFSNFTSVNTKAVNLTGLTRGELLSTSLSDALMDKEQKEKKKVLTFLAGKAQQLKENEIISFEARLQFKERVVFAAVRISGYEVMGKHKAIIIIRDTSKEKILESELDYKLKELAGIKEALPGLYLKVDKKGVIQEYKTTDLRYNIAVFPSDFVGKKPSEYLDKATVDIYLENISDVIESGVAVHGSFTMKYAADTRFYEATISPIKGEDNVIVLVNNVDKRKGLENKIHDLYALSSNREAGFVKNMDDILEFGKQIFGADVGLIMHFSGDRRDKILINYATENEYKIRKGIETPVDECYLEVRNGQICALSDTRTLDCKDCLHTRHNITSMISAPLLIAGKVEGAITFLTVNPNQMIITEEDENFIGFIGGLMGMALELRQAKKAVDSGISTLKKLISTLDIPAVITSASFEIKNANDAMLQICGVYNIVDLEDMNIFTKFTLDSVKAEGDFRSAYKISKGGVFDFNFDMILADGKHFTLLWHVVEIKDSKGSVRGFLFVSESIKDVPGLRGLLSGPMTHI